MGKYLCKCKIDFKLDNADCLCWMATTLLRLSSVLMTFRGGGLGGGGVGGVKVFQELHENSRVKKQDRFRIVSRKI
jgi:hypothetical protein